MQRQLYTCLYNNCNPEPFARWALMPCGTFGSQQNTWIYQFCIKTRHFLTQPYPRSASLLWTISESTTFAWASSRATRKHAQVKQNDNSRRHIRILAVYRWITRNDGDHHNHHRYLEYVVSMIASSSSSSSSSSAATHTSLREHVLKHKPFSCSR